MQIIGKPFSTMRVIFLQPEDDPSNEPLLAHAGIIIAEDAPAIPAWDGVTATAPVRRIFCTSIADDFTGPELRALASILNRQGIDPQLPESAHAKVQDVVISLGDLLKEVTLDSDQNLAHS